MNQNLVKKIEDLKQKRNAIILVHNYQIGEVQDIADFVGDSLELSRIASKNNADVILFCGVLFMAETASILSPNKTILMPDISAGCPMADMITPSALQELKDKHPDALVVSYVNSSAEIKAMSDVCCTSANAIKVVNSLPKDKEIIFVPDKYLGNYAKQQTKRDNMILWNGYCPSHVKILPEDILAIKKDHPGAKLIVHPECTPEVIAMADSVCSTAGMVRFVKENDAKEIIVGTEVDMIYRLKKEAPNKIYYPASKAAVCPNMKLTTLEKILWSLEDMKTEVKVPQEIQAKAINAVNRMVELI